MIRGFRSFVDSLSSVGAEGKKRRKKCAKSGRSVGNLREGFIEPVVVNIGIWVNLFSREEKKRTLGVSKYE